MRTNTLKWGSHKGGTPETEKAIIDKMVADNFKRPVRIVVDQFNRVWADNTHSVCSWVLRKGAYARLQDIPYYVVDLSKGAPVLYDVKGTLSDSLTDIRTAIACSRRITVKVDAGFRPVGVVWTIQDIIINMGVY